MVSDTTVEDGVTLPRVRVLFDPQGHIFDISDYGARLLGFKARVVALGKPLSATPLVQMRHFGEQHANSQVLLRYGEPLTGKNWVLTAEGWHFVRWHYDTLHDEHTVAEGTLLTQTLPYYNWIQQIDYAKQKLRLDSLVPGLKLDRKDLDILRLDMKNMPQGTIAELIGVSKGTVEGRLRKLRKRMKPLCTCLDQCSPEDALRAAGLEPFLMANRDWLAFSLKIGPK